MALAAIGPTTRPAVPADAEAIAALLGELGYPSTSAHVEERLARLSTADYAVFVAVADGRVAGLMGLHRLTGLHLSEPGCYVNALVVAAEWRGRGIGPGIGLGLAAGALVGAAVAARPYYGPDYYYPAPAYVAPPPVVYEPPVVEYAPPACPPLMRVLALNVHDGAAPLPYSTAMAPPPPTP